MKLLLQILFFVIIHSFAYSQESKADYYFGVDLRWATVCEYDISLEKCTSDDVGAFHMDIEKYPDKIGSLTLDYKGLIKFNILDVSFSDPDNYVLKLSDNKSKLYNALLSMEDIPNSRARMYARLIISDGVEALVFETDIGAIEYMTQIEDELYTSSKSHDSTIEERKQAITDRLPKNIKNLNTGFSDPNAGKIQDISYSVRGYTPEHSSSSDSTYDFKFWVLIIGIPIYLLILLGILWGIYLNFKK
ncbi:hypothetical protein D3C87_35320 [compost metagenome]